MKKLTRKDGSMVFKVSSLEAIVRNWSQIGVMPMTKEGEPGLNNAHSITHYPDKVVIITTEGKKLIFIPKEIK